MKIQRLTYLSLGSNQGEKLKNLQKAIYEIAETVGAIQKISSIYKTSSWGYEGEDFYNISISVSTYLQPESLLEELLTIESKLGRERNNLHEYTDRKIDIDILLFDDEIIFSRKITIPHPKMLERKFVLVPLVEIAKNTSHPIEKKQLYACLNNCKDTSSIEKISSKLIRPIPLTEKYNYIAVEGNIGAGKTSLASLMSDEFNARVVLERFADNPFLPKFYEDKERFAFPLEMSFLADRYQQLSDDLSQFDLFKNFIVSDYYMLCTEKCLTLCTKKFQSQIYISIYTRIQIVF
jgi:deoxyguanosine kinase